MRHVISINRQKYALFDSVVSLSRRWNSFSFFLLLAVLFLRTISNNYLHLSIILSSLFAGLSLVISLSGPTGPAPPNFSVPDTGTAGPVKSILLFFPIVLSFLQDCQITPAFFLCSLNVAKGENDRMIVKVSFCYTILLSDHSNLEEKSWVHSIQLNESGPTGPAVSQNSRSEAKMWASGPRARSKSRPALEGRPFKAL